jgi:hypothetical protein
MFNSTSIKDIYKKRNDIKSFTFAVILLFSSSYLYAHENIVQAHHVHHMAFLLARRRKKSIENSTKGKYFLLENDYEQQLIAFSVHIVSSVYDLQLN